MVLLTKQTEETNHHSPQKGKIPPFLGIWSFFTLIHNRSSNIWLLHIYTSHHFPPHGRYELNKLTLLPMCGFIAQLVEHRTGIAEVMGSNPVEALIFFRLLPSNCLNWKIYCEDHSSLLFRHKLQCKMITKPNSWRIPAINFMVASRALNSSSLFSLQ